jgi:hypothetical protein
MTMTKLIGFVLPFALAAAGCGDSTTTDMGGGNKDLSMMKQPDMTMQQMQPDMVVTTPPAPKVGTQIERMGRPTINVAVTNPFGVNNKGESVDVTRDKYNADSNIAMWQATWTPYLAATLAIYDGADTMCGNQAGACAMLTGCPQNSTPDATRYLALAGVLADDQVYLDTTKATCGAYLAVETAALGAANNECGGRTPLFNVVHETYTLAVTGVSGIKGNDQYAITDGTTGNKEAPASLTAFPFLGDPN